MIIRSKQQKSVLFIVCNSTYFIFNKHETVSIAQSVMIQLCHALKGVLHYTNTVLSAEHVKVININKRIMMNFRLIFVPKINKGVVVFMSQNFIERCIRGLRRASEFV